MKKRSDTNEVNIRQKKQGGAKKKRSGAGKALTVVLLLILLIAAALVLCLYALFSRYYSLMDYTDVSAETISPDRELEQYLEQLKNEAEGDADIKAELREDIIALRGEKEHIEGITNILLIGVDDSGVQGGSGTYAGSRNTDSMILCTINPKTKKIILTSLMRDTLAEVVKEGGEYVPAKLNTAYRFGGYAGMFETIERNFGIECDRFATVNFASFMDIVSIVGGVDIYVTAEEAVEMNNVLEGINELYGEDISKDKLENTSAGMKHLNGKQALSYARIRYLTGSDFGRTERQRKLIMTVFSKLGTLSVGQLDSLLNALLPKVSTNLTQAECAGLIAKAPTYLGYEIVSLRIPADGTYEGIMLNRSSMLKVDLCQNYRLWKNTVKGN